MKKLILTSSLLVSLFSLTVLYAQRDPVRDEFLDAEFFLAEEFYTEALQAYIKVYNAGNQENANINYRIGVCYLNIPGEKAKAIPYLEKAVKNVSGSWREGNFRETSSPFDAYLYLGNAYRINYQLDDAIKAYSTFLEINKRGLEADLKFAKQQIEASERAKKAIKQPAVISMENLGRRFNTNQNNFQPVFSGDGNTMAFMTSLRFYDAVYSARKLNNTWTNTVNITPQIESDGDQYVTSLSYDGTKMYLVQVSSFGGNILESDFIQGRWTKSRSLDRTINSRFFESHASISPDGKTLYFTSNRRESIGGMDIFMSEKDNDGNWGQPVNLGPTVNTPFNEESPFIANDGKTLFFSSQGHESIGGYDIFYTVRQDDGSWSKPVALPYPVNTSDDDLYFFPAENGKAGYMSMIREDNFGSGDIYFINLHPEEEVAELIDAEEEPEIDKEDVVVADHEEIEIPEPEPVPVETIRYIIRPVYFGFDKSNLDLDAIEKLDAIINILKAHPEIILEVRGHTDAMGPLEYNQILSDRRAESVTGYITGKGINKERLRTKGLNEGEPIALNNKPDGTDSPDGRRFNRRVEFRIIINPDNVEIIKENEVPEHLRIK